jgi:ABC-type transport system involved in multi-copper enzyme maturation permease subunit
MRMNDKLRPVWLISKRELRDQLRDWRILLPLIILTIIFPFMMNSVAYEAVRFANQYGGNLVVDGLVPFSILIIGFFPITISLLGALESFVGEKERGTIEPLLGSPLADWQLYLGKLIVGIVTPLVSSFIAIGIYLFMVSRQQLNMPDNSVFIQLFLLTIAHALLMVSAAIVLSVQSTSVKAANLMASFIIVPVAMLMMGESSLLFWANNQVLWLAVVAVLIMAGLLVRLGLAHFQREYLLGREIDVLNVRWIARTFWGYFKGDSRSFFGWYRYSVGATLRKLWKPVLLLVVLAATGIGVTYFWAIGNLQEYIATIKPEQIADPEAIDPCWRFI